MFDQAEFDRCARSLTYFGLGYVRTRDVLDPANSPKPLEDLPQLRFWDTVMQNERLWVGAKSRQMLFSIQLAKEALWRMRFRVNVDGLFQSDVQGKAAFGGADKEGVEEKGDWGGLLGKVSYMEAHLPQEMRVPITPSRSISSPSLAFTVVGPDGEPNVNTMYAVSSKATSVESKSLSFIRCDEIGLQPNAQEASDSAQATLGAVGSYGAAGTVRNRNFHYRAMFGLSNSSQKPSVKYEKPPYSFWNELHPDDPCFIMVAKHAKEWKPGIWYWRTEGGFLAWVVHYSADPGKRRAWAEEQYKAYSTNPSGWRLHFEIDWYAMEAGEQTVCPSWKPENIRPDCRYQPDGGMVYRSFDFGNNPACVWAQRQGEQIRFIDCLCPKGVSGQRFGEMVAERSKKYGRMFENYGDIGGKAKFLLSNDQSVKSFLDALQYVLNEEARANGTDAAHARIRLKQIGSLNAQQLVDAKVMQRLPPSAVAKTGEPGLIVNPQTCGMIVDALGGRLKLDPKTQRRDRDGTLEHPYDATKILIAHLFPDITKIISYRYDEPVTAQPQDPFQKFMHDLIKNYDKMPESQPGYTAPRKIEPL